MRPTRRPMLNGTENNGLPRLTRPVWSASSHWAAREVSGGQRHVLVAAGRGPRSRPGCNGTSGQPSLSILNR